MSAPKVRLMKYEVAMTVKSENLKFSINNFAQRCFLARSIFLEEIGRLMRVKSFVSK